MPIQRDSMSRFMQHLGHIETMGEFEKMVGHLGLEPSTIGLKVLRL